jgi:hypothetical protein
VRAALVIALAAVLASPTPPQAAPRVHADGPGLVDYDVDARAPWSPDEYDGVELTTDAPDLNDLPAVHAVYMVPADLPDRFLEFAAMFQSDARQASDRLRTLYGRAIRFDERSGEDSKRHLDITVVRAALPNSVWLGTPFQAEAVHNELRRAGLDDPDKKYAVWLDAVSWACGTGELYQDARRSPDNLNERSGVAVVYRNYARSIGGSSGDPDGGGFCRGRVLLHELTHTFGAVLEQAPHYLRPLPPSPFGAHCNDSAEDVMCYPHPGLPDTGGPAFDYGNDDYWDPAANPALDSSATLGWWTVNLSRFVCPVSGCEHPNPDPGY